MAPEGATGPGASGPRPLEWDVPGGPTVVELRALAQAIGVHTPNYDSECELLLDAAQSMVEVACGVRFTPESFEALDAEQQQALATAIVYQAVWLSELEGDLIGPTDITGLPDGVTFSRDPRPRLSPAVLETLALRGLIVRSGMARPDPAPAEPVEPCWWP